MCHNCGGMPARALHAATNRRLEKSMAGLGESAKKGLLFVWPYVNGLDAASVLVCFQCRGRGLLWSVLAMENFIAILVYLLIGFGLRHLSTMHRDSGKVLNAYVIHISLPALVLLKVPSLSYSGDLLILLLIPWVTLALSWLLVMIAARLLRWDRPTIGCMLLLTPLANTAFLGIPMVRAFLGETAIPYALVYDQFGSFMALTTYGSLILVLFGSGTARPTVGALVRHVVTFPPFIALVVALLLRGETYPSLAQTLLQHLADTLVPVVMVAVGFQLTLRLSRAVLGQLAIGLVIKLMIAPLAALLVCRWLRIEGMVAQVAVFEAAMPPMVAAGAMAIAVNLAPSLAAAMVGVGVLMSFVTLPLLHRLLVLLF